MIYVDEIKTYPKGMFCHMWSTENEEDLHAFAKKINVKKSWFHVSTGISGKFPHYDLTPTQRQAALEQGAESMSLAAYLRPKIVEALKNNGLLPDKD